MEVKATERTVIVKPVASRPTSSNLRSSELLAGAINVSPSSEPIVTAIRPKTVRFKPVVSSPPVEMLSSQAELAGTQDCHSFDKISKFNRQSPLLYKPLAKTVSRTTASMLANMGTFQAAAQNLASQSETVKGIVTPNLAPMKSANDEKYQPHTNSGDRPSYDGYNWRKYGQKQVKGSGYPRSYYKCTHPNCPVKKKVERSIDGEIAEIVYKGEHTHSKPRLPRRHTFDGTTQDSNPPFPIDQLNYNSGRSAGSKKVEVLGSSSQLTNLVKVPESYLHVSSEANGASMVALDYSCGFTEVFEEVGKVIMEAAGDEPTNKRRTILNESNKAITHGEGLQEPQIVVQNGTDSDKTSDGFRWRKYGQKVVKGNPYPRSYYRCTGLKCNVRKHVERASDDPTSFITTYEGKHNHDMPCKKANLISEQKIR